MCIQDLLIDRARTCGDSREAHEHFHGGGDPRDARSYLFLSLIRCSPTLFQIKASHKVGHLTKREIGGA